MLTIGAALAGGEHAARRLLRPEEHGIEIGADHPPPFLLRQLDRAVGMRDAGIVDQDGDGAERLLGRIEGARHGVAVEHVGARSRRAAAGGCDARLDRREPIGAARHQRDRGTVLGQHLGEPHAEPARRAGDQRDPAGEIEKLGCAHAGHHRRDPVHAVRNANAAPLLRSRSCSPDAARIRADHPP